MRFPMKTDCAGHRFGEINRRSLNGAVFSAAHGACTAPTPRRRKPAAWYLSTLSMRSCYGRDYWLDVNVAVASRIPRHHNRNNRAASAEFSIGHCGSNWQLGACPHLQFLYTLIMGSSKSASRKSLGRPATGRDPAVTVRLPEEMLRAIDSLAHAERITRSEALRKLLEPVLLPPIAKTQI
jgi:hypothetical protein